MNKLQKGFTLVELLVVIGILAILTTVVLVAVNPGKQLKQARNTQRRANVNTIVSAVSALIADPDATATMPTVATCGDATTPWDNIDATGGGGGDGAVDLESVLVPEYVADMPEDPLDTTPGGDTGYRICVDTTGVRYTVDAPSAEDTTISVTR